MPLIIVTGTPCSGKTFRTQQILDEFRRRAEQTPEESKRGIIHLPSHHATLDPPYTSGEPKEPQDKGANPRDVIYNSARQEKIARGEEFSAIKRALSKNTVVIADAPNYIKGFRYQLFCEAKAAGTRSVVLHTAAREDECVTWNSARLEAWGWLAEDDEDSSQSMTNTHALNQKPGGVVLGDLDPESHTAIYGDKVLTQDARSRSSSMSASNGEEHKNDFSSRQHRPEDTMTLKSLYINEQANPPSTSQLEPVNDTRTQHPQTKLDALPSASPPSPLCSLPYMSSTLRSLLMRYEPPSPFTRWDTPLFTVPSTDPHPPYDQIWNALFPTAAKSASKKAPPKQQVSELKEAQTLARADPDNAPTTSTPPVRQHAATVLPSATAPNALQNLESTTGEIVKTILAAARAANCADGEGGEVDIKLNVATTYSNDGSETEELALTVEIPEGLTLSQPLLQRLRRKFTQIQRGGIAHGQGHAKGRRGVAEGFVRFLEAEWGVDV